MSETRRIQIDFGAFAPPLHKQFRCSAAPIRHFQQDADALVRLSIRGILPDAQVRAARKRLLRKIEQYFNSGNT